MCALRGCLMETIRDGSSSISDSLGPKDLKSVAPSVRAGKLPPLVALRLSMGQAQLVAHLRRSIPPELPTRLRDRLDVIVSKKSRKALCLNELIIAPNLLHLARS